MNTKSFLQLVEIRTKVASVIPFLLGIVYTIYTYGEVKLNNVLIMFLAMILFDMATTATNNYIDYKKALKKSGFGYEQHNAIVKHGLGIRTVEFTIVILVILAASLGIVLYINTDLVVLGLGVLCFLIGLAYSLGPIPISRTPFGEILSGLTMGFLITFITVYISIFDKGIITLNFMASKISIGVDLASVISVFIISIPSILGISNIMLANNICDMEDDFENRRFTLPIYVGEEKALYLFKLLYMIGFGSIIASVIVGILPWTALLTIVMVKKVSNNINEFRKIHTKKDTFVLAVQNFVSTNLVYIFSILLGIFIG